MQGPYHSHVGVSPYVGIGPIFDHGLGGGMGMLHQSGSWYAQPQAMASADRGPFRIQLRLEVPQGGYGVFVPAVVGVRLPVR